MVCVPAATISWYLYARAADQYVSKLGFTVRHEQVSSPVDFLGGLGGLASLGSNSSSDTDILSEFISSQQLTQQVNDKLNLVKIWSKPKNDPYFSFKKGGKIEELVAYWSRMVKVYYNSKVGLIQVNVYAFDPQDAQNIAREIFKESSVMINDLSAIAQEDTTRYARKELDKSVSRLKKARQDISKFRSQNQIVDPNTDLQGQMGLLNSLQQRLADSLIEMDLLRQVTRGSDPRIEQSQRKINVIQGRIAEERAKLGSGTNGNSAFSSLVSEFEELKVNLDFAERAYVASLSAYDSAVSEAQRKSRYLAAYVKPTLAQSSQDPKRLTRILVSIFFLFMGWAIFVLVTYSIKDRR